MKHIEFINISPIQFFDSTQYNDTNNIEYIHDCQDENMNTVEPVKKHPEEDLAIVEVVHDYQDEDSSVIESTHDYDNEVQMEHFDDRDGDLLIDPLTSVKIRSNTLDISPNISEIPTGNKDGVIAKIPVVLAQLVIPVNITSSVDLPEEAIKIKDINKRLILKECVLLQPTNILYIKGFINKNIKYSTTSFLNLKGISRKISDYTIDIPFECSTPVSFFTQPLSPIENTKEISQYIDDDLSTFNQISEEFFNEIPFCKLLSSKIIEFDECINPKDSVNNFTQIREKMVIQIRIEVLQNQPVVILSATNKTSET